MQSLMATPDRRLDDIARDVLAVVIHGTCADLVGWSTSKGIQLGASQQQATTLTFSPRSSLSFWPTIREEYSDDVSNHPEFQLKSGKWSYER